MLIVWQCPHFFFYTSLVFCSSHCSLFLDSLFLTVSYFWVYPLVVSNIIFRVYIMKSTKKHFCFSPIHTFTYLQRPTWMVNGESESPYSHPWTWSMVSRATSHVLHHVCYALDTCGAKRYVLFHPFTCHRDLCLKTQTIASQERSQ